MVEHRMRKSPTAKRRMTRHRFDYCNDHGKHIPPPAIAVEAAHFHEPTQNNEQVSAIADLCTAVMCSKRKSSAVAESDRARANRAQNWGDGGCCAPFRGGAGSPSNAMSPWPRPTSVPSGILIHPASWPQ